MTEMTVKAGLPLPAGGVAISPWANLEMTGASYTTRDGVDPLCSREILALMARAILGTTRPNDPEVSPVFADVRGLPPILVQIGETEVMLSDAVRLATHLADSRVRTSLEVWPDMFHVWPMFIDVIPEARDAHSQGMSVVSPVVIIHLSSDFDPGMGEAHEQRLVEQFVAHTAAEALDVAVLHLSSRSNVVPLHADLPQHGITGELGSVVADDHAGLATPGDQLGQLAHDTAPGDLGGLIGGIRTARTEYAIVIT